MSGSRPAVLIVDDEPGVRELLREVLHDSGYCAVAVEGVVAALAALRAMPGPPSVVLADLRLPEARGLEHLRAMARACPGGGTTLYAMSGDLDRYTPEELREAGCAGVIRKPFPLPEVLRIVAAHSGRAGGSVSCAGTAPNGLLPENANARNAW